MKSTIKIDVSDLHPVIVVEKVFTEDLRDKFVCTFFEELGYSSNLCFVGHKGRDSVSDGINPPRIKDVYVIHPIPGNREGFKQYLSQCGGEQVRMIAEVCKELIDSYPKVATI